LNNKTNTSDHTYYLMKMTHVQRSSQQLAIEWYTPKENPILFFFHSSSSLTFIIGERVLPVYSMVKVWQIARKALCWASTSQSSKSRKWKLRYWYSNARALQLRT